MAKKKGTSIIFLDEVKAAADRPFRLYTMTVAVNAAVLAFTEMPKDAQDSWVLRISEMEAGKISDAMHDAEEQLKPRRVRGRQARGTG